MFPRARRKMHFSPMLCIAGVILAAAGSSAAPKGLHGNETSTETLSKQQHLEKNTIDFDGEYDIQFDNKYGINPSWRIGNSFNKNTHKYTMIDELDQSNTSPTKETNAAVEVETIPHLETNESTSGIHNETHAKIEKITNNTRQALNSLLVIPISKTKEIDNETDAYSAVEMTTKSFIEKINETSTHISKFATLFKNISESSTEVSTESLIHLLTTQEPFATESPMTVQSTLKYLNISLENSTDSPLETHKQNERRSDQSENQNRTEVTTEMVIEINDPIEALVNDTEIDDASIPIYTELDYEADVDVPEDYYDAKDLVPTSAPNTDALSLIAGIAGSVAETVAERLLPKSIYDLYKRMQKQNEDIEAERLRSREENGGLGQFGRGILKSLSSGLTRPLSQLMAGARDIGSLDSDRGFVGGLASGVAGVADSVASVATTLTDSFKERVQAIFPGTLWCGDGHSAAARSNELGLFFLTDTCCRQHDACKLYIRAGDTRYGLTNTGIFTRSHCSCDANFRHCLRRTGSLVSSQIGITYFNVLGPQCFRRAHPIVRCVRRTRITGQKCEEYQLDYSKPKMWQWFDSETF